MLHAQTKELLSHSKNLLAFSAGIDSTALFFILLQNNITFDIAIVDYGVRKQSKEEVAYAQELASKNSSACFVHNAQKIEKNFEAKAREIRYNFFENIIKEHNYDTLLTAHHLGDRFEWFLMQFCKGAGCIELSGMQEVETRIDYQLIRPLLHLDKQELLHYLHTNNIKYFQDSSNKEEKYKRNIFRHKHAEPLLKEYLGGIKKSFTYLDEDKQTLINHSNIKKLNQLAYFTSTTTRSDIYTIDKYLKSLNHLMTAHERALLKQDINLVVGRKYIISKEKNYIFIAPYIPKHAGANKELREKLRVLKIEPKLRAYLFEDLEALELVSLLLE